MPAVGDTGETLLAGATIAGWLLAPYLAWVSFAAFLNYTIVGLNAPFGVS